MVGNRWSLAILILSFSEYPSVRMRTIRSRRIGDILDSSLYEKMTRHLLRSNSMSTKNLSLNRSFCVASVRWISRFTISSPRRDSLTLSSSSKNSTGFITRLFISTSAIFPHVAPSYVYEWPSRYAPSFAPPSGTNANGSPSTSHTALHSSVLPRPGCPWTPRTSPLAPGFVIHCAMSRTTCPLASAWPYTRASSLVRSDSRKAAISGCDAPGCTGRHRYLPSGSVHSPSTHCMTLWYDEPSIVARLSTFFIATAFTRSSTSLCSTRNRSGTATSLISHTRVSMSAIFLRSERSRRL